MLADGKSNKVSRVHRLLCLTHRHNKLATRMSASVPSPPPFLPHVGEPPIPFETWRKIFDNYMLVIHARGDAWPDARRRAVLLHCLGPEGQRLFYTLPEQGTTYEDAMTALVKHFVPKVNVLA